jgi:hypothetical protein
MSEQAVNISNDEIVFAATNAPELAKDEFQLGDRTFKIVYLPYDEYILFFAKLEPVLQALAAKLGHRFGVSMPDGAGFDGSAIMRYCLADIPAMVQIIARQTEPDITIEEIKALGRTPFALAAIVMKQIERNEFIKDIAAFFGQFLPVLMKGKDLMTSSR